MRLFGLIGKPLTHSFSKGYFNTFFQENGIRDHRYENFELDQINALTDLVGSQSGLAGLNVTIPYKEVVLPYLHFQDEVVQAVGACNCIKISAGQLFGFNTDVIGFRESLRSRLKSHHNKALILGTGGAAKAVAYILKQLDIEYLTVSRKTNSDSLSYEEVNAEMLADHTLIVNTTPLGMYPHLETYPPIDYTKLSSAHLLYDLVYNPEKTSFLQQGEANGATILNGYEMLLIQAKESWRIWNDQTC
jgi:shikimate dehydrogenase